MQLTLFFDKLELERMYEQASLIICQAGVGSIMLGPRQKKKVISIARLAKFDEHIDGHQLEILDVFSKSGAALAWRGDGDPGCTDAGPGIRMRGISFRRRKDIGGGLALPRGECDAAIGPLPAAVLLWSSPAPCRDSSRGFGTPIKCGAASEAIRSVEVVRGVGAMMSFWPI